MSLKAGGITEGLQKEQENKGSAPCWEEAMLLDHWGTDSQGSILLLQPISKEQLQLILNLSSLKKGKHRAGLQEPHLISL